MSTIDELRAEVADLKAPIEIWNLYPEAKITELETRLAKLEAQKPVEAFVAELLQKIRMNVQECYEHLHENIPLYKCQRKFWQRNLDFHQEMLEFVLNFYNNEYQSSQQPAGQNKQ